MAKYTRFDPRNKKSGKHKKQTLNKDIRIREVLGETKTKNLLREVVYDDYEHEQDEQQHLTG